ncbi:uncharacterized protein LOC143104142 [Alosa pseudoharengus]
MDALFLVISRGQPGTEAISSQAMRLILEGSSRARSTYFVKKNILNSARAVFGPYLLGECHWTLFHCNLEEGEIAFVDSLGEQPQCCSQIIENWSLFAASRGCQRPWKIIKRDHDFQNDSVSCGVFSIMFAEMILQGQQGHLHCLPISQERERLGTLLFKSLDSSGICTVCYKKMSGKKKETCSFCSTEKSSKPDTSDADAEEKEEEEEASEEMEAETAETETAEAVVEGSEGPLNDTSRTPQEQGGFYVDSLLKVASSKKAKNAQLEEVQKVLAAHMGTYSLVTHTLGPEVCNVVFGVIKECLQAKKKAAEAEEEV